MSMNDDDLSALIRDQATRHTAGTRLRSEVRTQIALAAAAQSESETEALPAPALHGLGASRGWRAFGWRTALAGFTSGVAVTLAALMLQQSMRGGATSDIASSLDAELVADHVRSLRVGPLTQVVSTDRHTVKPWFQGKLDYAPPVLNLADDGFPLLGGRVEHINGESVAALVYSHRQHVLNLFVWPSTTQQSQQRTQSKGFNVLHWSDGTMQYWLVTDMDEAEVARFGQAWREQRAKH